MKKLHQRYHTYICNIVSVGDELTAEAIGKELRDYTPPRFVKKNQVFHHKDLPTPQVLSYILRVSPCFRKKVMSSGRHCWRRVV
jgi:hypothetical protein